jgi:hypothetical protein
MERCTPGRSKPFCAALLLEDDSQSGEFRPGVSRGPTSIISCLPAGASRTGFLPCFGSICGGGAGEKESPRCGGGGGGGGEKARGKFLIQHTQTYIHTSPTPHTHIHSVVTVGRTNLRGEGDLRKKTTMADQGWATPFILFQVGAAGIHRKKVGGEKVGGGGGAQTGAARRP